MRTTRRALARVLVADVAAFACAAVITFIALRASSRMGAALARILVTCLAADTVLVTSVARCAFCRL